MFKLYIIFALVAVALGKEYPPGVSPAVCPDYPYCDPIALTTHTLDGTPIPEWYYNPSVLPVPPVDINNPRLPADVHPLFYPYGRLYYP